MTKTYKNRTQMFRDNSMLNVWDKLEKRRILTDLDVASKTYLTADGVQNKFLNYNIVATSTGTYGVNGAVVAVEDAVMAVVSYYAIPARTMLLLKVL